MPQNRRWTWLVMIPWQSADNWPDTRMLHVCMNLFLLKQNRTEQNTTEESFWRWLPDRVTASRVPNISALWLVHDGNSTFWMLRNLSTNLQSNFGLKRKKERKKTRNKSGGKERGGKREREDEEEENSQRVTTPFERTTFIDTMQITRWLTTDNFTRVTFSFLPFPPSATGLLQQRHLHQQQGLAVLPTQTQLLSPSVKLA